jgi:hypothetical protein
MVIALSTTTITILRPRTDDDPYEAPPIRPVANEIRATIGNPSGRDHVVGGHQSHIDAKLNCDPCDLRHYDRVTDDLTGRTYDVKWVQNRIGLGLDHLEAGLVFTEGQSNG